MFRRFFYLLLLAAPAAFSQGAWFTVLGDPANPAINTIQVDPAPVEVSGNTRKLRVRVNRSADRTSWDGVPYRSYDSTVLFDCVGNTARYVQIQYYKQPVWKGTMYKSVNYNDVVPRWMAFKEVEPNPNERIVQAACGAAKVGIASAATASAPPASKPRK